MVSVEEYAKIYFTPPKSIEDFIALRSILSGYGATIGYEYVYPQKNFFRTKLYVSAPKSRKNIVRELVRGFGGRIREKETLVIGCCRVLLLRAVVLLAILSVFMGIGL